MNLPHCMDQELSLPSSLQPTNCLRPESDESSPTIQQNMQLTFMQFSQPPVISFLLDQNVSLSKVSLTPLTRVLFIM